MLSDFNDVSAANVDNRASNTLGGLNDNVVVLGKMEVVQRLDLLAGLVQHTLINGIWYAVVDELGQHKTVFAGIEHLECVGGEGQAIANVWVTSEDRVDMAGKLCSLIFVDSMRNICRRALDLNPATTTDAVLGRVAGV